MSLMKFLLLGLVAVLVCSCDNKIKSTDVQFVNNEIVYKDKNYTGQVWSQDGKSLVVEVSDGRPVKITLFHKNGNPAIVSTKFLHDGDLKHYDINGYEMTENDWETKYKDLLNKVDLEGEFPIFSD